MTLLLCGSGCGLDGEPGSFVDGCLEVGYYLWVGGVVRHRMAAVTSRVVAADRVVAALVWLVWVDRAGPCLPFLLEKSVEFVGGDLPASVDEFPRMRACSSHRRTVPSETFSGAAT